MAFRSLAEAIDEKLVLIAPIVTSIEQGGGNADLRDLGQHLVDAMSLFQRNPGIEAAADDLYAAATILVADSTAHAQPLARKLRLLREAHLRFRGRLADAAETAEPPRPLALPEFPRRRVA